MKYILESPTETLLETDDVKVLNEYIFNNIGELTLVDITETFHYIHMIYLGYTLMILK